MRPQLAFAAIAAVKRLAAAATAKEPSNKASLDGAPAHKPLAVGDDQPLIPLELGPGYVAFVVVGSKISPVAPVALHAPGHPLALVLDHHAGGPAAERIGACIDRVSRYVVHGRINQQAPDDAIGASASPQCGRGDLLPSEPNQHVANHLEFRILAELQRDGFLDASVGVHLDAITTRKLNFLLNPL